MGSCRLTKLAPQECSVEISFCDFSRVRSIESGIMELLGFESPQPGALES